MNLSIFEDDATLGLANARAVSLTALGIYYTALHSAADWAAVANLTARILDQAGWDRHAGYPKVSPAGQFQIRIELVTNVRNNYSLRDVELSFKSLLESTSNWTIGSVTARDVPPPSPPPPSQTPQQSGPTASQILPPYNPTPAGPVLSWSQWLEQNKTPIIIGSAAVAVLVLMRK